MNVVTINNQGCYLALNGEAQKATEQFRQAIALSPSFYDAWLNLAVALRGTGELEDAHKAIEEACRLEPNFAQAHYSRGLVLRDLGRYEEALKAYDEALRIDPTFAKARWKRVHLVMLLGQFPLGWELYEERFAHKEGQSLRPHPIDRWHPGTPLAQKTILVQAEQGFGDTLQFARFIPELAKLGTRIIVEVPRPLISLFSRLDGVTTVIESGQPIPTEVQLRIPIMSLALAFQTTLDSIPLPQGYLSADPVKAKQWKTRLDTLSGSTSQKVLRIGIVWAGGFRPDEPETWQTNNQRNIAFSQLAQYLDRPGVEWVSLQKGEPAESEQRDNANALWTLSPFINLVHELNDFDDTAALITQLDLVITVDTAIAHLAGALAVPTWVLTRFNTCWRWLLHRSDTPWYQSLRLYRQLTPSRWTEVLRNISIDLDAFKVQWELQPIAGDISTNTSMTITTSTDPEACANPKLTLLQTAISQYKDGKLTESLLTFKNLEGLVSSNIHVLNAIGDLLLLLNRTQEAIEYYTKVLHINDTSISARRHRGYAYRTLGMLDNAKFDLEKALHKLNDKKTLTALASVLWERSEYSELIQLGLDIKDLESYLPELTALLILAAHYHQNAKSQQYSERWSLEKLYKIAQERSDLVKGVKVHLSGLIEKLPLIAGRTNLKPNNLIPEKKLTLTHGQPLNLPGQSDEIYCPGLKSEIKRSKESSEIVYYIAADKEYAIRHVKRFIKSFLEHTNSSALHIHLMLNHKDELLGLNELLVDKNKVRISYEIFKPTQPAGYTVQRYTILSDLLAYYKRTVVLVDVDSEVVGSPDAILLNCQDFDVGIYLDEKEIYYRQLIKAGFFIANHTTGAILFLKQLNRVIKEKCRLKGVQWFADQEALMETVVWATENNTAKISRIYRTAMTWNQLSRSDTIIRTYKGPQKSKLH